LASKEVLDTCDGQHYVIDQVSAFVIAYVFVYDEVFSSTKRSFCVISVSKLQAPTKLPILKSRNMLQQSS
jgi:hypothetical protein